MEVTILVFVKEIPELEDDFELSGNSLDEKYCEYDMNQIDEYAVEEAVKIKEESEHDVEVVTVSIGPERSEETIRMALAKEADRAIRVWDDSLENVQLMDLDTKSSIFEAVVEQEDPDLIMTGAQADDDLFSSTGVHLAEELGWEWAAVVIDLLDYDPEAGEAKLHRELEGGVEEITSIETPAVMTIQSGINEPRYASLRGIRQAQSKPLDVLGFDDLGLDESVLDSPLQLTEMYEPEAESEAVYYEGDASEQAEQLAELLREKGVAE